MPGEFSEQNGSTQDNFGYKAPEDQVEPGSDTGFQDTVDKFIDEEALPTNPNPEGNLSPEVAPGLTDSFQDTLNRAIDKDASPENPEGDSSPEVATESTDESLPADDNSAPAAESPEMTPEERIQKGKELIEEDAAMIYDLANPKNVEFSLEQKKNDEMMEGLSKKFPHAFIERSTDDGRNYLLLKRIEGGGNPYPSIFSKYSNASNIIKEGKALMLSYRGVTVMDFVPDPVKYNFTSVLDYDKTVFRAEKTSGFSDDNGIDIKTIQEYGKDSRPEVVKCYGFERKDFDDVNLGILKRIFVDMEQSHKDDTVIEKPTAQAMLDYF